MDYQGGCLWPRAHTQRTGHFRIFPKIFIEPSSAAQFVAPVSVVELLKIGPVEANDGSHFSQVGSSVPFRLGKQKIGPVARDAAWLPLFRSGDGVVARNLWWRRIR